MIEAHLPILIALVFLSFALIIPLGALLKEELSHGVAVLGGILATALSWVGLIHFAGANAVRYPMAGWMPPIGIEFVYDQLSALILVVINTMATLVLIHSRKIYPSEFPHKQMPFYTVCMLLMLGFNGMVLTGDLFTLFVFLEIASLSGYALIAIGGRAAPIAAFRYLIIGTVGGSFYLLGLGFLYNVSGTLNMMDMAGLLTGIATQPSVVTGLLLMIVGIGLKAAIFPMHGWLPDSYTFASSTSTALIAPIGTKVAVYILIRILLYVFGLDNIDAVAPVTTILSILAAAGILYGSIMAIGQFEIKRMLAYSSVSQIGYIVLGITMASPMAFIGAILHIINHAVMKGALFLVAGNLRIKEGHTDLRRLDHTYAKKYPWSMAAFTMGAISMIGLPPLAGFFSKWYLVLGTIETSNWFFLIVLLISSLLNAVYFFRILEKVYLKNPRETEGQQVLADEKVSMREYSPSLIAPMMILALSLLALGLGNVAIVEYISGFVPATILEAAR